MKIVTFFVIVSTFLHISCSSDRDKKESMAVSNESVDLSVAVKDGPCSEPEYNQMDFWLGEWELRSMILDTSSESGWNIEKAGNTIRKILDGCVIEENFDGSTLEGGLVGRSYSTYRKNDGKWYQTWVDNNGSYLPFIGIFEDDRTIFRMERERDGKKFLSQMVFYNIEQNSLTWDWESSRDNGKTWNLLWRIEYSRKM